MNSDGGRREKRVRMKYVGRTTAEEVTKNRSREAVTKGITVILESPCVLLSPRVVVPAMRTISRLNTTMETKPRTSLDHDSKSHGGVARRDSVHSTYLSASLRFMLSVRWCSGYHSCLTPVRTWL